MQEFFFLKKEKSIIVVKTWNYHRILHTPHNNTANPLRAHPFGSPDHHGGVRHETTPWNAKLQTKRQREESSVRFHSSYLLKLLSLHNRICPRNLLFAHLFEIERTRVLLRVPVGPAEHRPAPALEPREPHAPPASHAPVRRRRLHRSGNLSRRLLRLCRYLHVRRRSLAQRQINRRRRNQGLVKGVFGRGRLLCFQLKIAKTFGAEILSCWAPEKSAVVHAQTGCLTSVLFRHLQPLQQNFPFQISWLKSCKLI